MKWSGIVRWGVTESKEGWTPCSRCIIGFPSDDGKGYSIVGRRPMLESILKCWFRYMMITERLRRACECRFRGVRTERTEKQCSECSELLNVQCNALFREASYSILRDFLYLVVKPHAPNQYTLFSKRVLLRSLGVPKHLLDSDDESFHPPCVLQNERLCEDGYVFADPRRRQLSLLLGDVYDVASSRRIWIRHSDTKLDCRGLKKADVKRAVSHQRAQIQSNLYGGPRDAVCDCPALAMADLCPFRSDSGLLIDMSYNYKCHAQMKNTARRMVETHRDEKQRTKRVHLQIDYEQDDKLIKQHIARLIDTPTDYYLRLKMLQWSLQDD